MGWRFLFNPRFVTFNKWYKFMLEHNQYLYDEYEQKIPFVDLIEMIEKNQDGKYDERYDDLDPGGYRFSKHKEFC